MCYLMMSEFCNRAELNSQWISTLHCGSDEDVPGAISSRRLYQEPLLRPAVWGADDTVVRVMAVFHPPSLDLSFHPSHTGGWNVAAQQTPFFWRVLDEKGGWETLSVK